MQIKKYKAVALADRRENITVKHTLSQGFQYFVLSSTAHMFCGVGETPEAAIQKIKSAQKQSPDLVFGKITTEEFFDYSVFEQ